MFALAVAARVAVVLAVAHEPVWDGQYYHRGAERIAAGWGYGDEGGPWSHYPIGYSAFLAPFYAFLGANPVVGAMTGALIGGLTAVAVAALARAIVSRTRAIAAGVIAAAHPGLVAHSAILMSEALAGLLLVSAALATVKLRGRPWLGALAGGALIGAATLVRPTSALVLPAVALLALDGSRVAAFKVGAASRWGQVASTTVLAIAGAVAAVSPWTARNCATLDACAVVSTNGGWNAAIGASPRATGRFEELVGSDGCGGIRGPVAEDACWRGRAVDWIAAQPWRWISLAPKKWSHTFDHQAFAIASMAESDPAAWPDARKRRWMRGLAIAQAIVLSCAALGVVAVVVRGGWKRRALEIVVGVLGAVAVATGAAWPLAVAVGVVGVGAVARRGEAATAYAGWAVATVVAVHAVFFGEDRYQVVVEPLLCMLACACFRGGTEPPALVASAA